MRLVILLFVCSVLIVSVGMVLPSQLMVSSEVEIQVSPENLERQINYLPNWKIWNELLTDNTCTYEYSPIPQGVGAYARVKKEGKLVGELYIRSSQIGLERASNRNWTYVYTYPSINAYLEGEISVSKISKHKSKLVWKQEIHLGESPFVKYLAYVYYQYVIEQEMKESLLKLKSICE